MKKRIKLQNKDGIPEEYNTGKVLLPAVDPSESTPMPGGIVVRGVVAYDETSDADVLPEQMLEGCSGYAKGVKVIGTMPTAQIQLFVDQPDRDGEVIAYLYFKTLHDQLSTFTGHISESHIVKQMISLPVQASQTYTPGTQDQVIAKKHWLLGDQTIKGDANLVPENIADGVRIFGVTGTHEGVLPTGRIEINEAFEYQEGQLAPKVWDVTDYAEAVVQDGDLTRWNIRDGKNVLGLTGRLQSPAFVIGNGQPAARLWFNKQYPWGQILPNLEYIGVGEYSIAFIGGARSANYDGLSFSIVAMKFGDNYVVFAIANTTADVIYTTAPIHAEFEDVDGNIIHIDADTPGWQGDYYEPENAVYNVILVSSIPDNLFASAEIAFGDWVKPTGTLTITQNGTYDVTNYAQIVVNVEGGGGGNATLEGDTLVFDGGAHLEGDTLVLDMDAVLDGDILDLSGGSADPYLDNGTLITSAYIEDGMPVFNAHLEGDILVFD